MQKNHKKCRKCRDIVRQLFARFSASFFPAKLILLYFTHSFITIFSASLFPSSFHLKFIFSLLKILMMEKIKFEGNAIWSFYCFIIRIRSLSFWVISQRFISFWTEKKTASKNTFINLAEGISFSLQSFKVAFHFLQ